jgi:hypothetical protein
LRAQLELLLLQALATANQFGRIAVGIEVLPFTFAQGLGGGGRRGQFVFDEAQGLPAALGLCGGHAVARQVEQV